MGFLVFYRHMFWLCVLIICFKSLRVQVPPEKGFNPQNHPKTPSKEVFGPLGKVFFSSIFWSLLGMKDPVYKIVQTSSEDKTQGKVG